jgi:adenylate cyclase
MQLKRLGSKEWQITRRQRRLVQAALVGLVVAAAVSLVQWAGLFTSLQAGAVDYFYETQGDPGQDILIVAIDEKSQQVLGDWPWSLDRYARLFERLKGADVIGFDVLLPSSGPEGNPDAPALLKATRQAGNVVLPLAALELFPPDSSGELYSTGRTIRPFAALMDAAVGSGSVEVVLDRDGTLRRVPLLVISGDETWQSFSLRVLRLRLGLGDESVSLADGRVVIGDETEIKYEARTGANGAMLVNFVGRPNTFPTHSFIDVIEDRIPASTFEDKIVLVGLMNALAEMDLHQTPVSAQRMSGVEFQANAIHTLLNHRPLVPQSQVVTTITVLLLALVSAGVLSQLEAIPGAVFALLLAVAYFLITSLQFSAGRLPNVLFPYATIFVNYAAVTATRFASERGERHQVTDIFGRFVSQEVRDTIVNVALENPNLIRPGGGREMEISVLFADIRGFTSISENLSPPEVVAILNQYLHSMEEEVFKQGGTLDKYTGDGMMVIFGAPLEQSDQEVAYGIGITTGPAVVGHIGSQRRLDYTAIGDTVNLAARLEGLAPPGSILINQTTYEAVKDVVTADRLKPTMVKGKAKPVTVYQVLGLRETLDANGDPS